MDIQDLIEDTPKEANVIMDYAESVCSSVKEKGKCRMALMPWVDDTGVFSREEKQKLGKVAESLCPHAKDEIKCAMKVVFLGYFSKISGNELNLPDS